MPLRPFNGRTFVAFIDISGFKLMMQKNDEAMKALTRFYQAGYDCIDENGSVQGFFVSDCGILFSDGIDFQTQLDDLLSVIKNINRRMLNHGLMLTTSIAYGYFSYSNKLEFEGIGKNPIYGQAYLDAYLDSANGKPKIEPGQSRLLLNSLSENQIEDILMNPFLIKKGRSHVHFYWNLEQPEHVTAFEIKYRDAYSRKFQGMLEALNHRY